MRQQAHSIHLGDHVLDVVNLPETAQQELLSFYEFLVFKYQAQAETARLNKQRILSQIFQEANGILPDQYTFDREALHER